MWRATRVLLQTVAGTGGIKTPNAGSSLLNPRSQRAKTRRALSMHHAQEAHFEDQVLFADIGGSGAAGVKRKGGRRRLVASGGRGGDKTGRAVASSPKNKAQRKSFHVRKVGQAIADKAQHMTDSEWESVSLDDKHAFTKYMSQVLKEHPTTVSEQQRRRYFETTMMDPRDLDPNRTVQDEYERIKLGLPVQIKNPQRALGVSQAIYDTGDASLFDPEKVHELENAMTDVKQVFADYIRKRREGVSTEAERRLLANLTADLNIETQRHLSHLFKYSEARLRTIAHEERKHQLEAIQRLRRLAAARRATPSSSSPDEEAAHADSHNAEATSPTSQPPPPATDDGTSAATAPTTRRATTSRKAALKASISKAIGLDVDVVDSILAEMDAQEQFFQFCEVFARLTVGRGFEHTASDETLDAYTESLKKLYSVDANSLSTLDVVQYFAAKENAPPVEWARRWYERAIMVPLQRTPEYQRLRAIQEEDVAALKLQKAAEDRVAGEEGQDGEKTTTTTTTTTTTESEAAAAVAHTLEKEAARYKTEKATNIVEKMFMRPDDARLQSLHEKRLRYLAYLQMERQIEKARENAARFAGLEDTTGAVTCRAWYQQILERKAACEAQHTANTTAAEDASQEAASAEAVNVFAEDAEAAALFDKIRDVAITIIQQARAQQRATEAAAKAARVRTALRGALGGDAVDTAREFQRVLDEKKRATAERLLGIMERDVTSEVQWLEEMEEADRPPLLPVPEGMSYVSAAEVQAWKEVREASEKEAGNPFKKTASKSGGVAARGLEASLFGQPWRIPDKPMLFWGTGTKAVQQALQFAAEDAERKRRGEPLAPPYPCPENPWGWRLVDDVLDD